MLKSTRLQPSVFHLKVLVPLQRPRPLSVLGLGCQFTKNVDKIEANGAKNRGEYDPIAVSLAAARQVTESAELVPS